MLVITDKEFKQLADHIKLHYGIFLKEEKKSLLTGRLTAMLEQNNINSFSEYYEQLSRDTTGSAAAALIDRITTNYTYFMRESEHFTYLNNVVLPYLEQTVADKDIRIWSAGCSTGEEPYTIAFLLEDYFSGKLLWDKQILASDIAERVLEIAKKGEYDEKQVEALPPVWRSKYMVRTGEKKYTVGEKLRREVVFKKINLISDLFHFKKQFHVIFCRNVMIYFDVNDGKELIKKFYECMAPGGYLFIGHSEVIDKRETQFKYVMPSVYRKL